VPFGDVNSESLLQVCAGEVGQLFPPLEHLRAVAVASVTARGSKRVSWRLNAD